jgi:hypothetical protein
MSDDDLDAIRARITPEQRAHAREMMKHVHPAYDRLPSNFTASRRAPASSASNARNAAGARR